jgi:aspartate racemase
MKTIGLIGGMSWHSTALYYQLINEGIQQKLGGLHSARIVMVSVEFAEIEALQRNGQWNEACDIIVNAAGKLEKAGADFVVVCTNTMHICFPALEQAIDIPLLHIADATADAILQQGFKTTGLLGTAYTMQMDYFTARLQHKGLQVLVPDEEGCERVNEVIFNELCYGDIRDSSRHEYLSIMNSLETKGAECIILGCTEIALLIQAQDTTIRLFDTTAIHAAAAVDMALT